MAVLDSTETTLAPAIIDGVKQAVERTFDAICGDVPVCKNLDKEPELCECLAGTISFLGDATFSFSLILPRDSTLRLSKKFCGLDFNFDSPEMGDVIGELANVVAGDVTLALERRRLKVQMSLPMVTTGSPSTLMPTTECASKSLAVETKFGRFWVWTTSTAQGRMPGT